jgi:hypothetical protein
MRRAPAPVGRLLAISVALLTALAGPLLLFNPWFVSWEQARTDVPARLGSSQQVVDRITGEVLGDLWTGGSFDVALPGKPPLLDAAERSHMRDVGSLVRVLATLTAIAAVATLLCLLTLRHERRRIGRLLLIAAGIVGVVAVAAALTFTVAFDQAFLAFHRLFFPQGNFLFGPDSNLLRLFPEPFWFEASLAAGVTIVVAAALVSLIGWRLWSARPAAA